MVTPKTNYYVDVLLLISFLIAGVTGIIFFFNIDPSILGMTRHTMKDWHSWSGIIMTIIVGIHLILHWKWIVVMTKKTFSFKKKE